MNQRDIAECRDARALDQLIEKAGRHRGDIDDQQHEEDREDLGTVMTQLGTAVKSMISLILRSRSRHTSSPP